jgi:hypothetical protein
LWTGTFTALGSGAATPGMYKSPIGKHYPRCDDTEKWGKVIRAANIKAE